MKAQTIALLVVFGIACGSSNKREVVVSETALNAADPNPFVSGTIELTDSGKQMVKTIVETLDADPQIKGIKIECSPAPGDIDKMGAARRVEVLTAAFVAAGMDAERIKTTALTARPGEDQCEFLMSREEDPSAPD